jgi:integrase
MRTLTREEIGKLLGAADQAHRALLATAVFTGLRLGELLGLTWANVDFEASTVQVRRQLARTGGRVEPKTPQAVRDVILMPALARMLREHRLGSRFAQPEDFVFASGQGRGLGQSVARKALARAKKQAKLDGGDKTPLRVHDLRHCFASLLIAQGSNVVFVSRQLGHGDASITLKVYAHLFDAAEHAQRASAELEASFGGMLGGNQVESGAGDGAQPVTGGPPRNVAHLPRAATAGE